MYIRQAIVTTLKLPCQTHMINAQQVQQSRIQIVYMHRVTHNVVTEVIGFAPGQPRLHATTSQPVTTVGTVMTRPRMK